MARLAKETLITSIDIGTTKICVLVGKKIGDQIEIKGIGKYPSYGLQKGVVVDVAKTIHSITHAVKEAEMMSGVTIERACIGIAGSHISSMSSNGLLAIKHGIVKQSDVRAILDAAQAVSIPQEYHILHVLPQYFIVNGQEKVKDPVGMHAVRLEVQVHIVMGAVSSVQNLINCCLGAGVQVSDIILEPLASATAVLSEDEIDLGVAVLDIGGGTSDFAVYKNGAVQHTKVFPVAGNHLTNDIAIGLRITKNEAERIKQEYGLASWNKTLEEQLIEVEMMQGNDIQIVRHSDVIRIIECRIQEMLIMIRDEIDKGNFTPLMTNGLVLTGGGSLLNGIKEFAEKIIDCPVRIGKPRLLFDLLETLQSPLYATAYGLLLYVLHNEQKAMMYMDNESFTQRVVEKMRSWVADFF